MKYLCSLLVLSAAAMLAMAPVATASEADQAQSSSTDPNMRWHNGQWWYWQSAQQRWLVWSGTEWEPHQPRRVVRSYSYMQDVQGGGSGAMQSVRPRSSSGGRITNSFGHRNAGSKVRGQY